MAATAASSSDSSNPSRELPWLCKPVTRWRQADDPFFAEGNKICQLVSKHVTTDVEDEEEKENSNKARSFPCQIASCKAVFNSIREYEMHYSTMHKNVCTECHRSFPSSHLLEIHVLEWHDNMFQLLATKQNMYHCLVESCEEKFFDARARKDHLVKIHRYPSNFRFDRPPPKHDRTKLPKKKSEEIRSLAEQQLDMETTVTGEGLHQDESTSSIRSNAVTVKNRTTFTAESEGSGMDVEHEESSSRKSESDVGDVKQSASGRTFVYNVPKNFSFGQGVSRGFSRGRRGGGRGRGKKKHWHQQAASTETKTNIEDVQFMELADALDDAS